jgi:hypothetical protein
MTAETNLSQLLRDLTPKLNSGIYIFATISDINQVDRQHIIGEFKEAEGTTLIMEKSKAEALGLSYDFQASWITLMVHSSLHAVGLTAKVSTELAKNNISCNVIAGYYHDHIFVAVEDTDNALEILTSLSESL